MWHKGKLAQSLLELRSKQAPATASAAVATSESRRLKVPRNSTALVNSYAAR